jgi:hypothetical protein
LELLELLERFNFDSPSDEPTIRVIGRIFSPGFKKRIVPLTAFAAYPTVNELRFSGFPRFPWFFRFPGFDVRLNVANPGNSVNLVKLANLEWAHTRQSELERQAKRQAAADDLGLTDRCVRRFDR